MSRAAAFSAVGMRGCAAQCVLNIERAWSGPCVCVLITHGRCVPWLGPCLQEGVHCGRGGRHSGGHPGQAGSQGGVCGRALVWCACHAAGNGHACRLSPRYVCLLTCFVRLKPLGLISVLERLVGRCRGRMTELLPVLPCCKLAPAHHSFPGTFIAGMLARHHRKRVHTLCLIDPVCFGMFMCVESLWGSSRLSSLYVWYWFWSGKHKLSRNHSASGEGVTFYRLPLLLVCKKQDSAMSSRVGTASHRPVLPSCCLQAAPAVQLPVPGAQPQGLEADRVS